MDPLSVISVVGSILGIIDLATRSIHTLSDLQERYTSIGLTSKILIGQLSTLNAALGQIKQLLDVLAPAGHNGSVSQISVDITNSLDCCQAIMAPLDQKLSAMRKPHLSFRDKTGILWHEKETTVFQSHLNNQINAMNLLLTALYKSLIEQTSLLQTYESRSTFSRIQDDASSLLWLWDADSVVTRHSTNTDNMSLLDVRFAFDTDVFSSRAYRAAAMSSMARALVRKIPRVSTAQSTPTSTPDEITGTNSRSLGGRRGSITGVPEDDTKISNSTADGKAIMRPLLFDQSNSTLIKSEVEVTKSIPTQRTKDSSQPNARPERKSRGWFFPGWLPSIEGLSKQLAAGTVARGAEIKILLLGSSKSGKSTAFDVLTLLAHSSTNVSHNKSFQLPWANLKLVNYGNSHRLERFLRLVDQIITYKPTCGHDTDIDFDLDLEEQYHTMSTGVSSIQYTDGPASATIYDVAGCRAERGKWAYVFPDTTKIFYFADAGCYDQVLTEEKTINRLVEELTLFEAMCNFRPIPEQLPIVLFMHKIDKLERKLRSAPFLHSGFRNYGGREFSGDPACVDDVKVYLAFLFTCIAAEAGREISICFTTLRQPEELGRALLSHTLAS
ncbi:G-protein alpha subunit-domain-containing protein [Aspergillus karnatakaensis]|uniref:G-protein alpha subunit-domain-containing protein n=1 Tax=Aspergillus karnatakaensis TaxID=1810916 RepID=UPI003CCD5E93